MYSYAQAMRNYSIPPDFNTAASVIQSYYRHYASGKVQRTALARFRSIERSIEKQIQASFPSYQHVNNQDFLQRFLCVCVRYTNLVYSTKYAILFHRSPPWPLFTMNQLEYDAPVKPSKEAVSDLSDNASKKVEVSTQSQPQANSEQENASIELLSSSIEPTESTKNVQQTRTEDRSIILKRLNELEKEQRWLEQAIIARVEVSHKLLVANAMRLHISSALIFFVDVAHKARSQLISNRSIIIDLVN